MDRLPRKITAMKHNPKSLIDAFHRWKHSFSEVESKDNDDNNDNNSDAEDSNNADGDIEGDITATTTTSTTATIMTYICDPLADKSESSVSNLARSLIFIGLFQSKTVFSTF